MKIKYDFTNNYLKYYNEGTGAYSKIKIKKFVDIQLII